MSAELACRLTIPELVAAFDSAMDDLRAGVDLVRSAEEKLKAFHTSGTCYDLTAFTSNDYRLDFEAKRIRMRGAAWRYLVSRAEIKKVASLKRCEEIDKMLASPATLPEITVENLMGWVRNLDQLATEFVQEAAVEVFEWLRPARREYKTNNPFKVGKRVVLRWMVESNWSGGLRVRYSRAEDELRALDNLFHMLDGRGVSPSKRGELVDALDGAKPGEFGETTFFRFRAFKNGNLHLEFLRPDLVKKLNEIGGKGLPQPAERGAA